MFRRSIQFIAMACCASIAAPAGAVTIFSDSFEDPPHAGAGFATVPLPGWTQTGVSGVDLVWGSYFQLNPHSGNQQLELDSYANGGIERIIDPGIYTVSFWYAPRMPDPQTNIIELLINGTVALSVTGVGGPSAYGPLVYSKYSYDFTLESPGVLAFQAAGTSDGFGGALDDVELTGVALPPPEQVPEPATWAMLLGGLGLLRAAGGRISGRRAG